MRLLKVIGYNNFLMYIKNKLKITESVKRIGLFAYDVITVVILIIPMLIQWSIKQLFFRKKKSIKGKLALITGGANGLGKAIGLKLATKGCNVAIVDIDEEEAAKTVNEIARFHVLSNFYKVDVTNANEIIKLRNKITQEIGDVDILINNAGIVSATSLEESAEKIELMVKVNLVGPLLMTKYFLEQMINRGSGHIVSISSMAGLHPSPYIIQYTATKFGINGFMGALTEYLRLEKLSHAIKTTCVFPYYIKTNEIVSNFLNPRIRFQAIDVNEVASKIVAAIQREDKVITLPKYSEFCMKIVNLLPLRLQQRLFRDRILREYEFKNFC